VETYKTEEEQVEALKKWWDENGRSTLAAVGLALFAGLGWNQWQDHQAEQAEHASAAYEEMLAAAREAGPESDLAYLQTLAERVKAEYGSTTYALFASLHLARIAVTQGRLDDAEAELRWVLTQGPDAEIRTLAELRLARVNTAQGKAEEALGILGSAEAGAYEPAFAEARGDAWLLLGEKGKAIAAYENAVALAAATNVGASEGLRLKLRALTPVPARELAATSEE
jgi:predicted negative regulator of RcsB-dependent stress response